MCGILCVHHDPILVLVELDKYFKLKPALIGDRDLNIGAKLRKVQLNNNAMAWGISPPKYVNKSVKNYAKYGREHYRDKFVLPKTALNPFQTGCEPGINIPAELIPEDAS